MSFKINQGDPENELILQWMRNVGFIEEDPLDEKTKFDRFKRFYFQEMADKHNGKPFLQQRDMEPFELLLLKELGGLEIMMKFMGKNIDLTKMATIKVLHWTDPQYAIDNFTDSTTQPVTDFLLLTKNRQEFQQQYQDEISKQQEALNNTNNPNSMTTKDFIFYNELNQIFNLF